MEEQPATYASFELCVEKIAQTNKRLIIVIILLILALIGSNAAWIYYESQFVDSVTTTTQTVEQDAANGENHFIGGDYIGNPENNN